MKPVAKVLKRYIALSILLFSASVFSHEAPFSQDKTLEIQDRVNSMTVFQLNDRKAQLLLETEELEKEQSTSQSPSRLKSIASRLNEVFVELNIIQKALVFIGGAGILGSLADDDSRDTSAPVVIVTSGIDTIELGGTWTDAGATATDASGNTGTATRTVRVSDTTAPVITPSATFSADENQKAIGKVIATDLQSVTFSVSGTELVITAEGKLSFETAPDYETKSSYTATVTVEDASANIATQDITVTVNDIGGIDDDPGTGTSTGTETGTGA